MCGFECSRAFSRKWTARSLPSTPFAAMSPRERIAFSLPRNFPMASMIRSAPYRSRIASMCSGSGASASEPSGEVGDRGGSALFGKTFQGRLLDPGCGDVLCDILEEGLIGKILDSDSSRGDVVPAVLCNHLQDLRIREVLEGGVHDVVVLSFEQDLGEKTLVLDAAYGLHAGFQAFTFLTTSARWFGSESFRTASSRTVGETS